jgi:glycosyltransferase involved in cell wall biosynthesis
MPYVLSAVESVLRQSFDDLAVVVIDNCSTDGTADAVAALRDPRVLLVRNESNIGLEGNWNKALTFAGDSEFFKLLCADDLLAPEAIATEVSALDAYPQAVMTASRRAVIDEHGRIIMRARGLTGLAGMVDGHVAIRRSVALGTNNIGEPSCALVRSWVFDRTGPFNGRIQYCIDMDMWARVLHHGGLYAIRDPLASFRVGRQSNSSALARKQRGQTVAMLRALGSDPAYGVPTSALRSGLALAAASSAARRVLYAFLDHRARTAAPAT